MSDDIVNIEVDGKPVEGRKGQMIIEVTDSINAYVPRFCYHEKLSIAANCRMCLVEVEKAPKPLPACATPINEGMKVFTKSPFAIAAQKATMEFLLINHPLDCPICDQGGECELQDLAMGYGRDVSRYNAGKRVVKDKDIGPLVSTDMTRCIHCTRCVRFGEEITGKPQLGTTERGENVKISTYVEMSVDHELSANIIDLCPVGALNNKPYRYSARSWEMVARPTVSAHDCVGSNLTAHVLRGTVKRIVPRVKEAINETWISDRDRFSYEAIYSPDRLKTPRIKENGVWRDISWEDALAAAADALREADAGKTGLIASPGVTVEEGHLLAQIADHLDTANIDHRITRRDTTDQDNDPMYPSLGCSIADIEQQGAVLVAGSNVRAEAPIIAHRLRKAALNGAKISFANSVEYEYFFDVADYLSGDGLAAMLAGVAVAAADGRTLPTTVAELCAGISASEAQQRVAASLKGSKQSLVLLGNIAGRHASFTAVRALAAAIAEMTGAKLGSLSEGPNAAGAHLAGVLPHRTQGGENREVAGLDVANILATPMDAVVLVNVEPDADIKVSADAVKDLSRQESVIALTPFVSDALLECADLLLPSGTFAETSGTYVNVEGAWQSFAGVANPVGEARPTWKILRVLGNLIDAPGFNYVTSEDVRDEFVAQLGEVTTSNDYDGSTAIAKPDGADSPANDIDIPLYSVDAVVRRATALQLTDEARRAAQGGDGQ
ncbi:MAG: NADH-quinone oxidoreductase subunit NuoG [Gammaproteobacteria bacterium]|nr:NADH-quinone oxidoreductase subunit NuoG [Gammaproteobacteria bacterium]